MRRAGNPRRSPRLPTRRSSGTSQPSTTTWNCHDPGCQMSDSAIEAPKSQRMTPWTRRLILFLRIMAGVAMLKGIYHWSLVLGVGDGAGSTFENAGMAWQAATIFFAVIDLVSAVGLWLAAAWGG